MALNKKQVIIAASLLMALLLSYAFYPAYKRSEAQEEDKKVFTAADIPNLKQQAERGDTAAQLRLCNVYEQAEGLPKGDAGAQVWYEKAAAQLGQAEAQYCLGFLYQLGEGVSKDAIKSKDWYEKAALQGHSDAQFHLGSIYKDGDGVPVDKAKAQEWLKKSAAQGNTAAKLFIRADNMLANAHALLDLATPESFPSNGKIITLKELPENFIEKNFETTDGKALLSILEKQLPKKDEFETSAEYKKKIKESYSAISAFNPNDLFVFQEKEYAPNDRGGILSESGPLAVREVADMGREYNKGGANYALNSFVYNTQTRPPPKFFYDAEHKWYYTFIHSIVPLNTDIRSTGNYVGQNAFGVQKEVGKFSVDQNLLLFDNYDQLKLKDYTASDPRAMHANFIVPLAPEKAKQIGEKLRIIYLAKLSFPYLEVRPQTKEATIKEPYEIIYQGHYIHANLQEIIVYVGDTGEIILRKRFSK